MIELAEEHDRMDELTVQIIERALRDARLLVNADPQFRLAVNISAQTLANNMILYHFGRLRSRHAIPGKKLIIEVTETAPLNDPKISGIIRALCKDGITFSIDDFGTGHSTLACLDQVPVSEIKIDRRLVLNLATSEESAALVKGMIAMAHSLGKAVVAQGVEDDLTAGRLRQMGCDLTQGSLYSPAIPVEELLDMLAAEKVAA